MNENRVSLDEVRLALGTETNARGYRQFSAEGRALAMTYAHERLKAGTRVKEVATELGLIGWTLQRWLQNECTAIEAKPGFEKLVVNSAPRRGPVLHGACGVWVEGLETEAIAAVLRSLSCSA